MCEIVIIYEIVRTLHIIFVYFLYFYLEHKLYDRKSLTRIYKDPQGINDLSHAKIVFIVQWEIGVQKCFIAFFIETSRRTVPCAFKLLPSRYTFYLITSIGYWIEPSISMYIGTADIQVGIYHCPYKPVHPL